ncbi:bile acid:sodium symporter family protein [Alkalitalea saponilacus]|uniref:Solute carrier family 10 (Sodium/bile acid cotransporter), member 7 n=1 Tax=Alkalitalea saponilacus TaxID=889453 RepID=A0A1T5H2D2_9BACT|nr:bile acid:sodium symporter family protein [Alkalitalea saponilacus]SKC14739.1 solute carrier family 10 (sodium/bile acid cotransporter), member 7 [Alkalitalea saponilacus]
MIKWFIGLDKFVPALIITIILAWLFPEPGVYRGVIDLHKAGDVGITLIFLFYGLKLNLRKLRQDLSNWRLHLLVQFATFILFPLLILPLLQTIGKSSANYLIWLGFFFLAALPSTVSSSVVMVSLARGNVPGAIFNATFSSLAGIIITPLWMGIVITSGSIEYAEFSGIIVKLVLQVLVPVIAGIVLNRFLGELSAKGAARLKLFDQMVILLIVYRSFSESFYLKLFENTGSVDMLLVITGSLALFFVVYATIKLISSKLKFNREDTITALFSGSKKSLIHGTVMAGIIFSEMTGTGVILMPLMVYHTLQLVLTGIIARRKRNQLRKEETPV